MRRYYKIIRKILPKQLNSLLSVLLIDLQIKPTVNKKVKSPLDKGVVIFSADFEMAWAFRYSKINSPVAEQKGLKERDNIPKLLDLFEKYKIPVTWATVGHLFLDKCIRDENGLAHGDMLRPDYFENHNWLFNSGDWYMHDPCTTVESDPAWYAPDLIKQIFSYGINHEIGCHTFSHLDFSYKNCPKSIADSELQTCKSLAEKEDIHFKSFVFPGGTFGNYESLKENGFLCYRKPMRYNLDLPYIDSYGLIAIPSSLGLDKDPYGWSKEFHLKMIRKFLEKAIRNKLVCHFWFHPSMDTWYLNDVMPEVVRMVGEYRDKDKIRVLTMGTLAEEFANRNK
jgi:peptidoglycan/xylan/chitin deacetylase (PgdA/CDA1 family)